MEQKQNEKQPFPKIAELLFIPEIVTTEQSDEIGADFIFFAYAVFLILSHTRLFTRRHSINGIITADFL